MALLDQNWNPARREGAALFWYTVSTSFGLATDSIRAHKLRSFLTLLGVIIGVGSVILVGAAINGINVYAEESTSKAFGSESFFMSQVTNASSRKEFFDKLKRNQRIDWTDFTYLQEALGDQIIYSPYMGLREDVKRGSETVEECQITGSFAALPEIRDINVEAGRFFTEQEDLARQQVVIIGYDLQERLFPGTNPLGRTVTIKGREFTVIGVQEKLGSAFGQSQDTSAYIPYRTMTRVWGPNRNMTVLGKARPETGMTLQDALDSTRVAMRVRFKQKPNETDKFDTLTPDAIRGFIENITNLISAVVVPVTLISLVVGGIVIMNIMLVSVTERTKEIGVRKSLGARQSDIRLQFLLESALLAAFGGALGIGFGALLSFVIGKAFELTMSISLFYILLSLTVSGTVGIVSGIYPAFRAAKLDPVEALRAD
ncbi:MAG: ABC transporter permease [Bryobacterales bacterium]|jgi:putative ABC transport system permease protein|nr:ABC transporter permease [Bryobacterales bacterium]